MTGFPIIGRRHFLPDGHSFRRAGDARFRVPVNRACPGSVPTDAASPTPGRDQVWAVDGRGRALPVIFRKSSGS